MADGFDSWDVMNGLATIFQKSVTATQPVGDDDMGYFVQVSGMDPEALAVAVRDKAGDDPERLALLAATAIGALVLRDYQQPTDDPHVGATTAQMEASMHQIEDCLLTDFGPGVTDLKLMWTVPDKGTFEIVRRGSLGDAKSEEN